MKTGKKAAVAVGADSGMSDEEMKRLAGFKHWPPMPGDMAAAEARTAAQMARIDARIAGDPKLQELVDQVRAEAEVASQLCRLRKRSGKTQAEIAAAIGTTQSAVARIEHGQNLRLDTIYRYAAACGRRIRIKLVAEPLPALASAGGEK